jgi:hypothetical protein
VTPGALLACLPLVLFVFRPALVISIVLLFVTGLGFAYMPGFDQKLLAATDEGARGRVLAAYSAGLMGFQGIGFLAWGVVAEFASPRYVIAASAVAALLVVICFRPRQSA